MKRVQHFGFRLPLYWMLAVAICFAACKKGDTGPQGDAGEQGQKGDKGDKGDKGNNGDKGTANVLFSPWLDLTFTLNQQQTVFFTVIDEPALTDSILSMGEVKVYVNTNTETEKVVTPLPFVSSTLTIRPFFFVGGIELDANADVSTETVNGEKVLQYRYVLIPGGAALRRGIDWNNYEQVKQEFGLPD
jgi:hypothetical protein